MTEGLFISIFEQVHFQFTVKILKFRTPEKFAVITLKFEQGGSTIE